MALEHWKKYDVNLLLQKNAETLENCRQDPYRRGCR